MDLSSKQMVTAATSSSGARLCWSPPFHFVSSQHLPLVAPLWCLLYPSDVFCAWDLYRR